MSEKVKVSFDSMGIEVTAGPCLLFQLGPAAMASVRPDYDWSDQCTWEDAGGFLGDVDRASLLAALEHAKRFLEGGK
jgi:hypothetical protein